MHTQQALARVQGQEGKHLLDEVMGYKHPGVIHKLVTEEGMSEDEARALFDDTKRFLYLCGTNPGNSYGPTPEIDVGWHHLILHTKDYAKFCEEYFGRFLHHQPNRPGEARDTMRPHRTIRAAVETFGADVLSKNWEYKNPDGHVVLGPNKLEYVPATSMCGDSCGCSPCK